MSATRVLAQALLGASLALALGGCHVRLPQPGKPTAPQEHSRQQRPAPRTAPDAAPG